MLDSNVFRRRGIAIAILAAILVALLAFVALFDWNWLRGPIERYVAAKTGLTLAIGTLHVDVFGDLRATVHDLRLQDPSNALGTLLSAGTLEFRVRPATLFGGRPVLHSLSIADAKINLVRDEDGTGNWSREQSAAARPQERGEPQFTLPFDVEALALKDVDIRYRDARRKIDFQARVTSDSAAPSARRMQIEFKGIYGGDSFEGKALTAELLTLQNTDQPFPIRFELAAGRAKLAAAGQISDLLGDVGVDASVHMSGTTLASLYPTLPVALPSTPPYSIEGHLQAKKNEFHLTGIRGIIGRSDVSGDATFRLIDPRPFLELALRSQHLALADLGVIVGVNDPNAPRTNPTRVLPDARFDVPRLNAIDATVTMVAQQMVMSPALALEGFSANVNLKDGILRMQPLKFGFSGGDIISTIVLDGRKVPIHAEAALDFRRIQFSKLFPTLDRAHLSSGTLGAELHLTGSGQSIAELLASSNGSLGAAMSGGSISQTVVAAASLNGGQLLPLLVGGDKPVPVRCAAVLMDVKQGIARSTLMVLDTENARIDGGGAIDLAKERFELELRAKPKRPSILSLRGPIFVEGGFRDARVSVSQGTLLRGGAALALATVNPLAALLALIETGPGKDTNCERVLKPVEGALDQADEATTAPPRTTPAKKR